MASKNKRLSVAADIFEKEIEGFIRKIPLGDIEPTEDQPRQDRDANIEALSQSLQNEGLLQPIVVTKKGLRYSIIAGERRFRAAKLAGWSEIECRVLNKDPREKFKLAVIENLQREDLNPFDESTAYRRLKEEYQHTDAQLSSIIGKSRNYISEILSISEIPQELQEKAASQGIASRNLLIQLAKAHKANQTDAFLSAWESGELKTVKDAKAFVKEVKPSVAPTREPPVKNPITWTPLIEAHAEWISDQNLLVKIEATQIKDASFPLNLLEDELKQFLARRIVELSSEG